MSEPDHVWRQIEALVLGAETAVTLVAPFVKKGVFESVLAAVPESVRQIDCVTRWTPAEVAAGVSDPEIWDVAEKDERVRIRLCSSLHAKLYRADDRCLVGSANLTGKATGLAAQSNIEILVEVPGDHGEVARILQEIEAASVPATAHSAMLMRQQADLLAAADPSQAKTPVAWCPITRRPDNVFPFYSGRSRFPDAVEAGLIEDLALLDIPAGLDEQRFKAVVQERLHAIPELRALVDGDRLGNIELRRALAQRQGVSEEQAVRMTDNIAEWLRFFASYYIGVGSWELRKGREVC